MEEQTVPTALRPSDAFFRDAKSCYDGTCVLAAAEDRSLSLYPLSTSTPPSTTLWSPTRVYTPSDALLSYEWFPGASPLNAPYFAFCVGVKDHPVHLLDGNDLRYGVLVCWIESSGLAPFSPGIISSLAFRPDGSGLLAAGSFSGTIGIYDTSIADKGALIAVLPSCDPGGITKSYATLHRPADTNQRLGFDVDPTGTWLAAGDLNGVVSVWKADVTEEHPDPVGSFVASDGNPIGATFFTSDGSHLVTCSGSRRHVIEDDSDSDSEEREEEALSIEDSLKLWKLE
ncbi:hypothetical protein MNV49_002946 [Pseudohyphozyma bogoriensis]|nr:hypothetical protein MNV49_002946 [Pseudohyphozyma bogoriensis]